MTKTKRNLATDLLQAAESGTLLTSKHDPNSDGEAWGGYRTILTFEASASLCEMLGTESFVAVEYQDPRHKSATYVIEPLTSEFTPTALSMPSGSTTPDGSCDRIIAVSGSMQGWHVFGESQSVLDERVRSGSITRVGLVP